MIKTLNIRFFMNKKGLKQVDSPATVWCGSVSHLHINFHSFMVQILNWLSHKVHIYQSSKVSVPPRPNWLPRHPLSLKRVCPPPRTKMEGTHSPACERVGMGPNSDDWCLCPALCLLCGPHHKNLMLHFIPCQG